MEMQIDNDRLKELAPDRAEAFENAVRSAISGAMIWLCTSASG